MKAIAKEIDFKSLIIGFLLAVVVFLAIGAKPGSGTMDVRIVGVDTYDELKIKIEDVGYSVKVPVVIKDQPVTVTTR